MQFRRLDDDVIVTVSGDEAVASFSNNPAYAPHVEEVDGPPPAPDGIEPDDLPTRTVPELRGYAVEHGVDLGMAKTKAEIIHAIRAHFAALSDRQDEQV